MLEPFTVFGRSPESCTKFRTTLRDSDSQDIARKGAKLVVPGRLPSVSTLDGKRVFIVNTLKVCRKGPARTPSKPDRFNRFCVLPTIGRGQHPNPRATACRPSAPAPTESNRIESKHAHVRMMRASTHFWPLFTPQVSSWVSRLEEWMFAALIKFLMLALFLAPQHPTLQHDDHAQNFAVSLIASCTSPD